MAIQNKFNKANHIYKITKDIDLEGGTLNIPANCTLDFQGGSFSNGTLNGNNTKIIAGLVNIFNINLEISGTWNILESYPEWFGYISSNGSLDAALYINKAFCISKSVKLSNITYLCKTPILISSNYNLVGSSRKGTILLNSNTSSNEENNSIIKIKNKSQYIKIEHCTIKHSNRVLDYGIYGESTHHLDINDVEIFQCKYGIYLVGEAVYSINLFYVICNCNSIHDDNSNYGYDNSYGVYIYSTSASGTTLVCYKCSSRDCKIGYFIRNMGYSTLINSGVDNCNGSAFYIRNSKISMDSCACENVYATVDTQGCIIHCVDSLLNISNFNTFNIRENGLNNNNRGIALIESSKAVIINSNIQNYTGTVSHISNITIQQNSKLYTIGTTLPNNGTSYISYTEGSRWMSLDNDGYKVRTANNNIFKLLDSYTNIGTTAKRPTIEGNEGFQYYDTTLNKPIWWNGSKWVDANGNDVETDVQATNFIDESNNKDS